MGMACHIALSLVLKGRAKPYFGPPISDFGPVDPLRSVSGGRRGSGGVLGTGWVTSDSRVTIEQDSAGAGRLACIAPLPVALIAGREGAGYGGSSGGVEGGGAGYQELVISAVWANPLQFEMVLIN